MNPNEIIEHWIQQIQKIPANEFIPIPDFAAFESRARTESLDWCKKILAQPANPHLSPGKAYHSYHVADLVNLDLLRHEYTVAGHDFTLFEGVNFLMIQLPAQKGKPWTRESIEEVIGLTLNLPEVQHHGIFQYPASLAEGTLISTAPTVDPSMMDLWNKRVDILLRQGKLYVICYKRYPPIIGFLHGAQWFEDELRFGSRQ